MRETSVQSDPGGRHEEARWIYRDRTASFSRRFFGTGSETEVFLPPAPNSAKFEQLGIEVYVSESLLLTEPLG